MNQPRPVPRAIAALLLATSVAAAQAATPAPAPKAALPAPVAKATPAIAPKAATTATPAGGAAKRAPARAAAAKSTARPTPAAPPASGAAPADAPPAPDSSSMTLRGGQEGTVFRTLTIEGEDRVQVEFERPALDLDLDPARVAGLDLGTARDVLDRTLPDLTAPLLASSNGDASPCLARPWLQRFGSGAIVRFRPATRDVERWKLIVVDSRGQTVRTYQGRGRPPEEISWDGRAADGTTAVPGLTYSYAFEAWDKAGNRRNVVGPGFGVSAFSFDTPQGPVLAFSGRLLDDGARRASPDAPPLVVREAASRIAQSPGAVRPLRVTVTARNREQADQIASAVARGLGSLTPGDPARIQGAGKVEPDAPEGGVVRIAPADAR